MGDSFTFDPEFECKMKDGWEDCGERAIVPGCQGYRPASPGLAKNLLV
jgi:hypothetical protein